MVTNEKFMVHLRKPLKSPTLTSHSATGFVVGGLACQNFGKGIVVCGGLYGLLYVIERLRWTNDAKEKAFKNQFVAYTANCLQSVLSLTSSNCIQQVMSELSSTFAQLCYKVDAAKKKEENEISKLSEDITDLERIESQARLFSLVTKV
ncbi:mitofusin-2-like [Xenia sp. Carnegie-2017]|uniref:mitofusin-2-like n=1 Tax=Xenia sp. Carnegie-2017 TaxID=2897299 RepID=UPI001F049418|nr:mitofusin-2-like [Xenia sp. Carnegie-2017]